MISNAPSGELVTSNELAARVGCGPATIRYHMRDRRGRLYGKARKIGTQWVVTREHAECFAASWRPHQPRRSAA